MQPHMIEPISLSRDTVQLGAYLPVADQGVLAVNAYLIQGEQPVLVDTGLAELESPFLQQLKAQIDLAELRWIWLTHMDPDHIGNLNAILALAPQAQVVTNFLGAGKLNLLKCAPAGVHLLEHGQVLDIGDRQLMAWAPPTYDAPETMGLIDRKNQFLFSSDCFGALLPNAFFPEVQSQPLSDAELHAAMQTWALIDTPWIKMLSQQTLRRVTAPIITQNLRKIFSSHLPSNQSDVLPLVRALVRCGNDQTLQKIAS